MKNSIPSLQFRLVRWLPLLFFTFLFNSFLTGQVNINYSLGSSSATPIVYACTGGTINLTLSNANSGQPISFPLTLQVNFTSPSNANSNTIQIGAVPTATWQIAPSMPPGLSVTAAPSGPGSSTFNIVISASVSGSTFQPGNEINLSYLLTPSCSLIQEPIAPYLYTGSTTDQSIVPAYTLYSAGGGVVGSMASPSAIHMKFADLSVSVSTTPTASSVCGTASGLNFGVVSGTTITVQTYAPPQNFSHVYRAVTVQNDGDDFVFSSTNALTITEDRTILGLKLTNILNCSGTSLLTGTGIITFSPYRESFVINQTVFDGLTGTTSQPLSGISSTSGGPSSFTFIEEFAVTTTGQYGVCGQTDIQSNITCDWGCGSNLASENANGICFRTLTLAKFSFPQANPNLTSTLTEVPSYCYVPNGVTETTANETQFTLVITNAGTAPATTFDLLFKANTGWTDYKDRTFYATLNGVTGNVIGTGASSLLTETVTGLFSPPVNNKTIELTAANGFVLNAGDYITLSWSAYTDVPTTCGTSIMNNWTVNGSYYGLCNGSEGFLNGVNYQHPVVTSSTNTTGLPYITGPDNVVGIDHNIPLPNNDPLHQFPYSSFPSAPVGLSVHLPSNAGLNNVLSPNPALIGQWPYNPATAGYIVQIEIGSDLDVWNNDFSNITFTLGGPAPVGGTVVTPHCIHYVSNGGAISSSSIFPGVSNTVRVHDVIEAAFNIGDGSGNSLITKTSMENMVINLGLEPDCYLAVGAHADGGQDPVIVNLYEVPDTTCDPGCSNINRVPMVCNDDYIVQVECPGCEFAGVYNEGFQVSRTTFGMVDNNGDGIADPPGIPITFSPMAIGTQSPAPGFVLSPVTNYASTRTMMYNDVFRVRTSSLVSINNSGVGPTIPAGGFTYLYARVQMTNLGVPTVTTNNISTCNTLTDPLVSFYYNPSPGSSAWSGPFTFTPSQVVYNGTTGEFCYGMALQELKDAIGGVAGQNFTLTDGIGVILDFSYKVSGALPYGPLKRLDIFTTVYGGLRHETMSSPSDWLVQMQGDQNFGNLPYLQNTLCNAAAASFDERNQLLPGTAYFYDQWYPYSSGCTTCPNTSVTSCDDIRYFCVNGGDHIELVGSHWNYNTYLTPTPPATLQQTEGNARVFTACGIGLQNYGNGTPVRSLYMSDNLGANDAFQYEYRNWVTMKRMKVFTPPSYSGGNIQIVSSLYPPQAYTSTTDYYNYDYAAGDIFVVPTGFFNNSQPPFVDYTSHLASVASSFGTIPSGYQLNPDDAFTDNENIDISYPCTPPTYLVVREVDSFCNGLAQTVSNMPITQSGDYPETFGQDERYKDTYVPLNTSTSFTATAPTAIGTCGSISWTIPVATSLKGYFVNPWVGFNNAALAAEGWTITSVQMQSDPSNIGEVVYSLYQDAVLDPANDVWDFPSDPSYYASTYPDYYQYHNAYNVENNIIVTASYCANNIPTVIPKAYVGSLCNILTYRQQGGLSLYDVIDNSCASDSVPMEFILQDPIMHVVDNTQYNNLSSCGVFDLSYTVSNLGYKSINDLTATIFFPAGSGYALATGQTVNVNYNSTTLAGSVVILPPTSAGTTVIVSIPTGSSSSQLFGELNIPSPPTYSLTVSIPIVPTCPGPGTNDFTVTISGNNGCSVAPAGCPLGTTIQFPSFSYNPLVTSTGAIYDNLNVVMISPENIADQCTSNLVPYSFTLQDLSMAGTTQTTSSSYLDISLPSGYVLAGGSSSITCGGQPITLITPPLPLPSTDIFFNIPVGLPTSNIPVIVTLVPTSGQLSCSSTISATVYSKIASCDATICPGGYSAQSPTGSGTITVVPVPILSVSGTCTQIVTAAGGCDITWTDNGSAISGTSSVQVSAPGQHVIEAISNLNGCTAQTSLDVLVPTNCNGCSGLITTDSLTVNGTSSNGTTICAGQPIYITTYTNGAYIQYYIDNGADTSGIEPTPLGISTDTLPPFLATPGTHTLCVVSFASKPDSAGYMPCANDTFCVSFTVACCAITPYVSILGTDSALIDTLCIGTHHIIQMSGGLYGQLFFDGMDVVGGYFPIPPSGMAYDTVLVDDQTLAGTPHQLCYIAYSDTFGFCKPDTACITIIVRNCGCEAIAGTNFILSNNVNGLTYAFYDSVAALQPNFINWFVDGVASGQTTAGDTFYYALNTGYHIVCMQTATILTASNGENICCYNTVCDTIDIDACTYWKATDTITYSLSPTNIDSVTFTFQGSTLPISPTLIWDFGDGQNLVNSDLRVTHYFNTNGQMDTTFSVCVYVVWSRGDSLAAFDSTGVCCCLDTICLPVHITPCSLPTFFISADNLNTGGYEFVLNHSTSFTDITSTEWAVTYPDGSVNELRPGSTNISSSPFYPSNSGTYVICTNYQDNVIYPFNTPPFQCGGVVCDTLQLVGTLQTNQVTLYPNPTTGQMVVEIANYQTAQSALIQISDVAGQSVMLKTITNLGTGISQNYMDVSGLAQGVYSIKTTVGTVKQVNKLVKE